MLDNVSGIELSSEASRLSPGLAWFDWIVGGAVVVLEGEHDLATVDQVEQAFASAECAQPEVLVVDLSGCAFIDLTIVRALRLSHERAETTGRMVVFVVPSSESHAVQTVLRLSGLADVFAMHATLEDALEHPGVAP